MRHARLVRVTHWVSAAGFLALAVSSVGILLAHPRFYWGESGFFDTPAAFELPVKPVLQELWVRAYGRNVHFLAAWITVLNGLIYAAWGLWSGHFLHRFLPDREQRSWSNLSSLVTRHLRFQNPMEHSRYNTLQKLAYAGVVFCLMPLLTLSGLTMSPGFTATFPQLFTLFGGRQSARTIHFLLAVALVLFVATHVLMTVLSGFRASILSMTTGSPRPESERAHP